MPLPNLGPDGLLPLGRWVATVDEVHGAFVAGKSAKRGEVWNDWLELTAALRELVHIPAAWLSGSLLSDKDEPGDVDSVYIAEWAHILRLRGDADAAGFIEAVSRSRVKEYFQLQVDSFILEWFPMAGTQRHRFSSSYHQDRGYWDDLWTRQRSNDLRLDALPRRGYVEVILDGYI